jgi:hypothetical protein
MEVDVMQPDDEQFLMEVAEATLRSGAKSEDELLRMCEWAQMAKITATMLRMFLAGSIELRGWEDSEPVFGLAEVAL